MRNRYWPFLYTFKTLGQRQISSSDDHWIIGTDHQSSIKYFAINLFYRLKPVWTDDDLVFADRRQRKWPRFSEWVRGNLWMEASLPHVQKKLGEELKHGTQAGAGGAQAWMGWMWDLGQLFLFCLSLNLQLVDNHPTLHQVQAQLINWKTIPIPILCWVRYVHLNLITHYLCWENWSWSYSEFPIRRVIGWNEYRLSNFNAYISIAEGEQIG